jgi:hypothetical protein
MTAYGLIYLLAASCSADASFGDVDLWYVPPQSRDGKGRLVLSKHRPMGRDVRNVSTNENGAMREGA